jgi:lysophospholipase L1-like esterase
VASSTAQLGLFERLAEKSTDVQSPDRTPGLNWPIVELGEQENQQNYSKFDTQHVVSCCNAEVEIRAILLQSSFKESPMTGTCYFRTHCHLTFVAAAFLIWATQAARADILQGLGLMGDSASIHTAAFKWPEVMHTNSGLNFGPNYAYDHAVGGATSATVLSGGQNTALAADVTAGNVTLGMFLIGNNDYGDAAQSLANDYLNGTLGTVLPGFEAGIVSNVETATQTVLNAGVQGFLLGSVPDFLIEPAAASVLTVPDFANQLYASQVAINSQLMTYADAQHIPFVNFFGLESAVAATGQLVIGGVNISLTATGTDPHDFFEDSLHPGYVGNAIISNLWMEAINVAYGTHLPLYSDQQILAIAGLSSEYKGETFSTAYNLANYVHFTAAPEPNAKNLAWASLVGFVLYGLMRASRPKQLTV